MQQQLVRTQAQVWQLYTNGHQRSVKQALGSIVSVASSVCVCLSSVLVLIQMGCEEPFKGVRYCVELIVSLH